MCKTCGVYESRNNSLPSSSALHPLSLSLTLIHRPPRSLVSSQYCPVEAGAQLYSRGAERTDVFGRRGRGRDEQVWLSNIQKKKIKIKRERREHINKPWLYMSQVTTLPPLPLYASQDILYDLIFLFLMLIFDHSIFPLGRWNPFSRLIRENAFCINHVYCWVVNINLAGGIFAKQPFFSGLPLCCMDETLLNNILMQTNTLQSSSVKHEDSACAAC